MDAVGAALAGPDCRVRVSRCCVGAASVATSPAGVDAGELRLHLLDKYEAGVISTSATDIRVAFSCLSVQQVKPLFAAIHGAIADIR